MPFGSDEFVGLAKLLIIMLIISKRRKLIKQQVVLEFLQNVPLHFANTKVRLPRKCFALEKQKSEIVNRCKFLGGKVSEKVVSKTIHILF